VRRFVARFLSLRASGAANLVNFGTYRILSGHWFQQGLPRHLAWTRRYAKREAARRACWNTRGR